MSLLCHLYLYLYLYRFRYQYHLPTLVALLCAPWAIVTWSVPVQAASDSVQLLQQYIQIDTVNPPGYTTAAVDFLAAEFSAMGVPSAIIGPDPDKPSLIATITGSTDAPSLMLVHHMDVVPAGPDPWQHPPMSGAIADGQIWGRGTVDTKSLGILQLEAIRQLLAKGQQPKRTIHYVAMPDEETQGPAGAGWFVREYLPTLGNVGWVMNEGALGNFDMLAPDLTAMLVQVAEKQPLWLTVRITGESGHGSAPHGRNAADALIRALDRLKKATLRAEITPTVAAMLAALGERETGIQALVLRNATRWPFEGMVLDSMAQKSPQANSSTRNTCSLTELRAGVKANVIPPVASATLDCRLLPSEDLDAFMQTLRTILLGHETDLDLQLNVILQASSGPESPTTGPVMQAIQAATLAVYPDAMVAPFMSAGYTDSAFFRKAGIPAYGFNPLVLSSSQIDSMHNINERIDLEAWHKAQQIYADFLYRIVQTP